MKNFTLLFVLLLSLSTWGNVENKTVPFQKQNSEHIKEIMTTWDKEKGLYLYESMSAMVMHEQQPERPESVNKTPFELLQTMDDHRIKRLDRAASNELENERKIHKRDNYYWQEWKNYLNSSRCDMNKNGKSSGDPHMRTFDGEAYDFQNAGDYLLSASEDNSFMIQTQQVRTTPSIALNGGISMNINGDLVTFSSVDKSKGEKMIHVNNQEIQNEETNLVLPQGGVVEYNKKKYLVKWPTGEQASISQRKFKDKQLFDIMVYVPECKQDYYGLLGNNDGSRNDLIVIDEKTGEENTRQTLDNTYAQVFGEERNSDFVTDKRHAEFFFITRPFASQFQLDSTTSLLRNQLTDLPDDIRYPEKNLSLAELDDEQIEEGIRKAKEAGVKEEDLFEAVYDYGHLGLEPIAFQDDYVKPKESNRFKEPKLDKNGRELENKPKSNSNIRISPSIFIGTGVRINPPRRTRPNTSPRPSTNQRRGSSNSGGNAPRTPRGGSRGR